MFVSEYGLKFRIGTSYDMSGSTSLSLVFTKPSGETLTVVPTAPATPVSGTDENGEAYSFAASTYFEYPFADMNVDEDGLWRARGIYIDASKRLTTDNAEFTVDL